MAPAIPVPKHYTSACFVRVAFAHACTAPMCPRVCRHILRCAGDCTRVTTCAHACAHTSWSHACAHTHTHADLALRMQMAGGIVKYVPLRNLDPGADSADGELCCFDHVHQTAACAHALTACRPRAAAVATHALSLSPATCGTRGCLSLLLALSPRHSTPSPLEPVQATSTWTWLSSGGPCPTAPGCWC